MLMIGLMGSTQIQHIEWLFLKNGLSSINVEKYLEGKSKIKKIILFVILLQKIDILYIVGQFGVFKYIKLARFFRKKVMCHWIGTDVLNAVNNVANKSYNIYNSTINLAGSPNLQEELASIGIHSYIVPILPSGELEYILSNEIDHHAILIYMPEGREKFYGYEFVHKLVVRYKKCKFHIVANNKKYLLPYDNVIFHGYLSPLDMAELYNHVSILLRLPEHDGLSLMLLEALGRGKQVIYTYNFPYCHTPTSRSIEDVIICFDRVLSIPPFINKEAHDYITRTYNTSMVFDLYKDILGLKL